MNYFEELLNEEYMGEWSRHKRPISEELEHLDEEDIRDPTDWMKNNKAPGENEISAELWKQRGCVSKYINNLTLYIWIEECLPEEWYKLFYLPLIRRQIFLTTRTTEGYPSFPFHQLLSFVERNLGQYQAGFRKGKATTTIYSR